MKCESVCVCNVRWTTNGDDGRRESEKRGEEEGCLRMEEGRMEGRMEGRRREWKEKGVEGVRVERVAEGTRSKEKKRRRGKTIVRHPKKKKREVDGVNEMDWRPSLPLTPLSTGRPLSR